MVEEIPVRSFDEVSAVTATGPQQYVADVDPLWTVGGKPNGGYLQAIMARAAVDGAAHPHVIAASTYFLRAPEPGKVQLDVEPLRSGRSASHLRVRLTQADQPMVETVFALGDLAASVDEPEWVSARIPDTPLPIEECRRFLPPLETFPVPLFHQVEGRFEPDSFRTMLGKKRGDGELRGWVSLPAAAPFDPTSLLLAADCFPPASFDIEPTGWVPTLELSTYVRALPAPGPVHVVIAANLIQGGRLDETVTIRDTTGRVVAQSHQLAGIRFGPAAFGTTDQVG